MSDDKPPQLGYYAPQRGVKPRSRFTWRMYLGGLMAGLAFSICYYILLATSNSNGTALTVFGAVIIKIGVGITLLFNPQWRTFGRGVILSIPIALLIGVGTLFAICSGMKL